MAQKICLFTAHSPQTGGGAVILRSLIKALPELSIQWKYLAVKPVNGYEQGFMGPGIMGSSVVHDITGTWLMLTGRKVKRIDEIVTQLLATDCDAYWVVSHNEGLRVAIELSRLQNKRPVHLTVHDDWAGALSARSVRYRFMAGWAKKMTITAMQAVTGADLISRGMQTYYYQLSKRQGEICHRYLPPGSVGACVHTPGTDTSVLNVGHIGSIYDKNDFIRFLTLLQEYAKLKGKMVTVNMWGYHPKKDDLPSNFLDMVKMHKDLPEEKAIPELAKCDIVYSMYPMSDKLRIFSQTSLPTKLTSYVQACRPIFGQGSADCTLAEFLQYTGTGVMWSSYNNQEGISLLEKLLLSDPSPANWQKAREQYFGENNLAVMRHAFQAIPQEA
ncbi:MAG: hypothetical protein H7Z13_10630 [Ferruginibacter sp.]|nr:hypothetical protein [Ferruginibacter sp.]